MLMKTSSMEKRDSATLITLILSALSFFAKLALNLLAGKDCTPTPKKEKRQPFSSFL